VRDHLHAPLPDSENHPVGIQIASKILINYPPVLPCGFDPSHFIGGSHEILAIIVLLLVMTLPIIGQTTSVVSENINNAGSAYYFHQRKAARTSTGFS